MSLIFYDKLNKKKQSLLVIQLDLIMKTLGLQYGYICEVNRSNHKWISNQRIVELYHYIDEDQNIQVDANFDFIEDIKSILEFHHSRVLKSRKLLIINEYSLSSRLFGIDNSPIMENTSWVIIPIYYYNRPVAILGLVGSLKKFNYFDIRMLQPFSVLCASLLSNDILFDPEEN